MKKYRFLVTGGAGFIGSHIAEHLLSSGHEVRILDNLMTGKKENVEELLMKYGEMVTFIHGDLRNYRDVLPATNGVDFVIHHGAYPSVPVSIDRPKMTDEINVGGTINILEAAKNSNVNRVVFASSTAIYGDTNKIPVDETTPSNPKSPYALQKLAAEYYMKMYHEYYGLETVSLRYFNIFGPRQDPQSMYAAVVPKFITALLKGERPIVYGDGEQTRDFTYVDNVVSANVRACLAPREVCGEAFNIGSGKQYSLLDLLSILGKITGKKPDPVFEPERKGDIKHSMADISRAELQLGYSVEVGFEEGLEKTVKWYRDRFSGKT